MLETIFNNLIQLFFFSTLFYSFLLKNVGNIDKIDIANNINICLPLSPTSVMSIKVYPISKFIILIGIKPKNVPKIKTFKGIYAIGDAQFTIVFGKTGDILTNKK